MKILITENQFIRMVSLVKPILNENVIRYIITETTKEDLVDKFVNKLQLVTQEKFNEIENVSNGKISYMVWLLKRVEDGSVNSDDISKYKNYFPVFDRFKRFYEIKDINQIKTKEQVNNFIEKTKELIQSQNNKENSNNNGKLDEKKYVSLFDIEKLKEVGINYLGMSDGYQVFEVPFEVKDSMEAYKNYKRVLGRCGDNSPISICTIASFDTFTTEFNKYPNSSYFVLFNLSDPQSPYQFRYEDSQFKDRDNRDFLN